MDMRNRIRDLREDSDLTQQYIAKYLGCDQSYYSKCERGVYQLHIDDLIKLAQFYKTSLDYLMGLTDERTRSIPKIQPEIACIFHRACYNVTRYLYFIAFLR